MTRPASLADRDRDHGREATQHLLDGSFRLGLAAALVVSVLVVITAIRALGGGASTTVADPSNRGSTVSGSSPGASGRGTADPLGSAAPLDVDVARYLVPAPTIAPPLVLTDQDEQPFDLSSLRGAPVFVFFGYTHCPDVCPATVGTVGLAMSAFGSPVRAVFVTVDPERDTPAWLREYVRYLATGFSAATGSPERIATVAAAWGVRYAKVATDVPGDYSMAHTADVLLVDAGGDVRARFPFGTSAPAMTATLRAVTSTPTVEPTRPIAPTPTIAPPTASATSEPPAAAGLDVLVDSASIWSGPAGPVIVTLSAAGSRIDDPDLVATAQLASLDGTLVGSAVPAIAVRPPGETRVVYVASLAIPTPGWWRMLVSTVRSGITLTGSTDLAVLDPGTSAAIGAAAPTIHTPTLDDVGGVAKAVTTDPAPDLRLSRTSTTDALAGHRPFVLVIDSWKFRVTSACGKALVLARYLVDRWPDDAFIHLEPLRYDVVTDTPVLEGSLSAPTLTDPAAAWGLAGEPWGATSMPWVFVVDGNGIVRAKAEGVLGTDDIDVILALIADGH